MRALNIHDLDQVSRDFEDTLGRLAALLQGFRITDEDHGVLGAERDGFLQGIDGVMVVSVAREDEGA